MQACRAAVAKERDVAGPLFQHEREILRPHELRVVGSTASNPMTARVPPARFVLPNGDVASPDNLT